MKKIIAIYLLLLNFTTFAWTTYLDIDNHSSEILSFGYNGTTGNAYGPCGENIDANGKTGTPCTLQSGGSIGLYFTDTGDNDDGTIAFRAMWHGIDDLGGWNYQGSAGSHSLTLPSWNHTFDDLFKVHTDGGCNSSHLNCIIFNGPVSINQPLVNYQ